LPFVDFILAKLKFVVPPLGGLNEHQLMKFGEKLNQLIGHF